MTDKPTIEEQIAAVDERTNLLIDYWAASGYVENNNTHKTIKTLQAALETLRGCHMPNAALTGERKEEL